MCATCLGPCQMMWQVGVSASHVGFVGTEDPGAQVRASLGGGSPVTQDHVLTSWSPHVPQCRLTSVNHSNTLFQVIYMLFLSEYGRRHGALNWLQYCQFESIHSFYNSLDLVVCPFFFKQYLLCGRHSLSLTIVAITLQKWKTKTPLCILSYLLLN